MVKLHIKKGDNVVVISGEDKGKTGKVLKVLVEKQRAIVEGVNIVSKSTKPSAKNPQGGIQKVEAPIHRSNLSLIDPKSIQGEYRSCPEEAVQLPFFHAGARP